MSTSRSRHVFYQNVTMLFSPVITNWDKRAFERPNWLFDCAWGRLRQRNSLACYGKGTCAGCKVPSDLLQLILKSGHSESLDFKRLLLKRTRKAFCSFSSKGSRPWLIIYLAWTYKYKVNGSSSLIRETLFFFYKNSTTNSINLAYKTRLTTGFNLCRAFFENIVLCFSYF